MFPTKLELDVLHAERLRQAEHSRMLRKLGNPSLFERIRARFASFEAAKPAKPAVTSPHQAARCDVPATSQ